MDTTTMSHGEADVSKRDKPTVVGFSAVPTTAIARLHAHENIGIQVEQLEIKL
jgi:hypothetical protein